MYIIYQKIGKPIKLSNFTLIPTTGTENEAVLEIKSDDPITATVVDISDIFYDNYILFKGRTLNIDNSAIRVKLVQCNDETATLKITLSDDKFSLSIQEVDPKEKLGYAAS
jgi:hypothetical protein